MVGHGGSSAGSYLTGPTSPIPSHCASIVATSTLRVKPAHIVKKAKGVAGLLSVRVYCKNYIISLPVLLGYILVSHEM